jgi:hypothetical protein
MTCDTSQFVCYIGSTLTIVPRADILTCDKDHNITGISSSCTDSTISATISNSLTISTESAVALHDSVYILWIGLLVILFAFGLSTALRYLGGSKL